MGRAGEEGSGGVKRRVTPRQECPHCGALVLMLWGHIETCHPPAVRLGVECRASADEIRALGPERAVAFMAGIASVLTAMEKGQ